LGVVALWGYEKRRLRWNVIAFLLARPAGFEPATLGSEGFTTYFITLGDFYRYNARGRKGADIGDLCPAACLSRVS